MDALHPGCVGKLEVEVATDPRQQVTEHPGLQVFRNQNIDDYFEITSSVI